MGDLAKTALWMTLNLSDIKKCPMVIFLPSHYREDGSCRCDEPNCESVRCRNKKYGGEIFCRKHLEDYYGNE